MKSLDVTYCSDAAKCKKRHKCFRFTGKEYQHEDHCYWWADYYAEWKASGRLTCENFIEG